MTDKMTAKIVRREDEPPKTNRPFPNITPEQAEWLKRQPIPQAKRKMLHVEVSRRTFEAVKARPEKLRLIAEDGDGNAVFEKPAAAGAKVGSVKWEDEQPLYEAEARRMGCGNEYVVSNYSIFAVLRERGGKEEPK